MDFFEAVKLRRSIRKFTDTKVPDEIIQKAISAALVAPNSSNMQPWEFYWVQTQEKKEALVKACLSQSAARTANHLVVAVSRIDTWKRNRAALLQVMAQDGELPKYVVDYYGKIVPMSYYQDPLGLVGYLKWFFFAVAGIFRPMPRGPAFKSQLFEVVSKTTALACENFMLAVVAQGYQCCPMEGLDEARIKKILGLPRAAHVVMAIAVGVADSSVKIPPQYRVDPLLVVHKV